MGEERSLHASSSLGRAGFVQCVQPHDDAGRTEAALAGTRGAERIGPSISAFAETLDGGHRPARDPACRRDACDPRLAVDQHGAAAALALRAAAVLRAPTPSRSRSTSSSDAPSSGTRTAWPFTTRSR